MPINSVALAAALSLAACGTPVFAMTDAKVPVTPHGSKDATTDPNTIRAMFRRPGAALVAISTGAPSGIVALDGDVTTDGDGRDTLRQWTIAGRLPVTRTHETRRGGVHILFRHDPAHVLRSTTGRLAAHVDTRGEGGSLIWWPGSGLRVLRDVPTDRLPVLPAWVADAVALPSRPPTRGRFGAGSVGSLSAAEGRLVGLVRTVALAPEGQRNGLLYWAACRAAEMVASGELVAGAAEAVMVEAGRHAGLPYREALATVRSGLREDVHNG